MRYRERPARTFPLLWAEMSLLELQEAIIYIPREGRNGGRSKKTGRLMGTPADLPLLV